MESTDGRDPITPLLFYSITLFTLDQNLSGCYGLLYIRTFKPGENIATPNVCPKCGAPLRPDTKTCIMGSRLCEKVASSENDLQSPVGHKPVRIGDETPLDPLPERVTNPNALAISFEDKTLTEPIERVDFCKGCGLHVPRNCSHCPNCGSSHHPPSVSSSDPGTLRSLYAAIKRGLDPHKPPPQIDEETAEPDPVVTISGPVPRDFKKESDEEEDCAPASSSRGR